MECMTALIIILILINVFLIGIILGFSITAFKKEEIKAASEPRVPILNTDEFDKINSLYKNFLSYDGSEQH